MRSSRIEALQQIVGENPDDAMARFMLASELYREGRFDEAVAQLEVYIKMRDDEGPAYKLLGDTLFELGKKKDARWAYRHGAEAARIHGHVALADEIEEKLNIL